MRWPMGNAQTKTLSPLLQCDRFTHSIFNKEKEKYITYVQINSSMIVIFLREKGGTKELLQSDVLFWAVFFGLLLNVTCILVM